jgi:hypothetical protein
MEGQEKARGASLSRAFLTNLALNLSSPDSPYDIWGEDCLVEGDFAFFGDKDLFRSIRHGLRTGLAPMVQGRKPDYERRRQARQLRAEVRQRHCGRSSWEIRPFKSSISLMIRHDPPSRFCPSVNSPFN